MAISQSEQRTIARRYANATLELTRDEAHAAAVDASFMQCKKLLTENLSLARLLQNPLIAQQELVRAMQAIMEKIQADALAIQTVSTVIRNQRGALLGLVAEAFRTAYHEHFGIKQVRLIAARQPSDALLAQVKNRLGEGDSRIELECETDESLIGGFILQSGSTRMDASVAGQLSRLNTALTQTGMES